MIYYLLIYVDMKQIKNIYQWILKYFAMTNILKLLFIFTH